MTLPADRDRLVEETLSAYRERDPLGSVIASAAFFDLDENDREHAFEEALRARTLEAAMDPSGQSSTVKAILARINAQKA